MTSLAHAAVCLAPAAIAQAAARSLTEELETYPKPGLVSLVDNGSHPEMDAACFRASIRALETYFTAIASAGADDAPFAELQRLGLAAERTMLAATGGRNTHRGAIYVLGLLAAAAGLQSAAPALASESLGRIVATRWGSDIIPPAALPAASHGLQMCHRHHVAGARGEALRGFPSVYCAGLPAFTRALAAADRPAARVHAFFALLAECEDTTLLKRGGLAGWEFAGREARRFLDAGGALRTGWEADAIAIHRAFVARNLTAGGAADLLAATLFIHDLRTTS